MSGAFQNRLKHFSVHCYFCDHCGASVLVGYMSFCTLCMIEEQYIAEHESKCGEPMSEYIPENTGSALCYCIGSSDNSLFLAQLSSSVLSHNETFFALDVVLVLVLLAIHKFRGN